jgi:hypothetical protein
MEIMIWPAKECGQPMDGASGILAIFRSIKRKLDHFK